MTARHTARLCATAALVLCAAAPLRAQRQTAESADAMQRWVTAVKEHVPGRPDPAVKTITAFRYSDRRHLNSAYPLFTKVLWDRELAVSRSEHDEQVIALARTARLATGPEAFLKRAAVLHADALIFKSRFPLPPDDAPARPLQREVSEQGVRATIPPDRLPPLLINERVTLTLDGEVVGDTPADWNLPFARSLLDELLARAEPGAPAVAAERDFIADWYHAVTAYLFARGMNGDAVTHLGKAARILPDEPRILFDRATYAEWFGLPIYQAVHDTAAARPGVFRNDLPSEEKTNAEAERLYRRALEIEPAYAEARVRLARLLERRGQRDEAAAQVAQVLAAPPTGVVGFYASIVAGRVAARRGRYEDALRHYRDASALFDRAQSAALGASHAALMLGDVPQTLARVEPLGASRDDADADPWLDYQIGAGRDVNALLDALWARAAK